MMRLRAEVRAGRHQLVALSANGHRDVVIDRCNRDIVNTGAARLLRALARRLGFKLVRREQWNYQIEALAKAHAALTELRKEHPDDLTH